MLIRYLSAVVFERTRKGQRKPELTCTCDAVLWPHRVDTVPGCYGGLICYHGLPLIGHPDYDSPCPACDREEACDIAFDRWRDERAH